MKFILVLCFVAAAIQCSVADTPDIKETLAQVEQAFEGMKETLQKNIDPEKVKSDMVTFHKNFETAMQQMNDNVHNYIKDHPDSPVAQMKTKMDDLVKQFKESNPEAEGNLQKAQQQLTSWGEQFTHTAKEAMDKISEEGGVKDQLTKMFGDWGEQMKKAAVELETKLKEMTKH